MIFLAAHTLRLLSDSVDPPLFDSALRVEAHLAIVLLHSYPPMEWVASLPNGFAKDELYHARLGCLLLFVYSLFLWRMPAQFWLVMQFAGPFDVALLIFLTLGVPRLKVLLLALLDSAFLVSSF